jgi:branched-chain amino acid transport system permease protein
LISKLRQRGAWVETFFTLAIVLMAIAYIRGDVYLEDVAILIATYSMIALGLYVPFIMGGALSMSYNAYLGIGAYAVAVIASKTGWGFGWGLPIGMALSAAVAVVLGFATRRLSGFFLASVTVLFGVAFTTWLIASAELTGGGAGIPTFPTSVVFGVTLNHTILVSAALLLVWIVAVLLARLRRSPFGVAVRASRRASIAVEASGIRISTIVLVSLALGAIIASLGGSMFALVNDSVIPESFAIDVVFLTVFTPLLGGQSTPWGAVLGAFLVVLFTFELTMFKETGTLLFALAVLVVLVAAPRGLLGYASSGLRLVTSRLEPR